MAAERRRIYVGDTLSVVYEIRLVDLENARNSFGVPAEPESAFVQIKDNLTGAFLDIGGPGNDTAPATIEPAEGTEDHHRGALVKYTVPSAFTTVPGDYMLKTTVELADGKISSTEQRFKVIAF